MMKTQHAFQRTGLLLMGTLLLLLSTATVPAMAQSKKLDVQLHDGVVSKKALSRSDLRTRIIDNLSVRYEGDGPIEGRVLILSLEKGSIVDSHLSGKFSLEPGTSELPSTAFPDADWFPDGAEPGAGSGFGALSWPWSWFGGEEDRPEGPELVPEEGETDEERCARILRNYMNGYGELPSDFSARCGKSSSSSTSIVVTVLPGSPKAGTKDVSNIAFVGVNLNR